MYIFNPVKSIFIYYFIFALLGLIFCDTRKSQACKFSSY